MRESTEAAFAATGSVAAQQGTGIPPFQALLNAQADLGPTVLKDEVNPAYRGAKYIQLPDLMALVHPVCQKHGLVLIQGGAITGVAGTVGVLTQVYHAATGMLLVNSVIQVPCKENDPQKGIGAVTYGRRTGITSAFAIAEADDDGNECTKEEPPKRESSGSPSDKKDLW
jgi:hypothetical protein